MFYYLKNKVNYQMKHIFRLTVTKKKKKKFYSVNYF